MSTGCMGGLLITFLLATGLYLILRSAGAFLIVADPLKHVDALVVLSGGDTDRVVEAAKLMKAGYARVLVITETGESQGEISPPSASLRREAIRLGVSADAILVTGQPASSTTEEAEAVLVLMEKRGFTSCIVVTDPFHSRRTRLVFRDTLHGRGISVRIHPVAGHWYRSSDWFFSREGWTITISEYAKLIGFVLGYR